MKSPVGTTAPQQLVTITNLGTTPVVMSGAGGGAGQFGGSQDCQGLTIAPGASCHMNYTFHPTAAGAATGSTGGNWNGQTFAFTFKGTGISGARTKQFLISPTVVRLRQRPARQPRAAAVGHHHQRRNDTRRDERVPAVAPANSAGRRTAKASPSRPAPAATCTTS